jgi:LPXTG-motif cell wall-anchored protein
MNGGHANEMVSGQSLTSKEEDKMKARPIGITLLVLMLLSVSGAIYAQGALQPGASIGGMSLRSGGSAGPPLWAFCSPAFLNPGVTNTECIVPPLPEVAIGHGCFFADEELRDTGWLLHHWEMYLDGQQIDLDAFGTLDDDLPQTGLPGLDPGEEVMTKLRSWDVVLVNPTVGTHTLRSVARFDEPMNNGFLTFEPGTYELIASFTVQAPVLPQTGSSTPIAMPLWLGAGGLLVLIVGFGLWRGARRAS